MLDMGYQSKQNDPDWFDVVRPTKLPSFENEFGEDGALLRRRPPEPPRREGLHPHRRRRDQDHLRVRAVRHRRGRGPDDLPPAPRLRRAGPVRRGPDLEPVHGHRRLPELDRVLGPERDGVLPQRAGALDAWSEGDSRLTIALERPGASADQGDFADRIELQGVKGRFPLPDLSAQYRYARRLGPRRGRRHRAPDGVGRPQRRRVRPAAATPPAGASTSARTSSSAEARRAAVGASTARASRTT